MNNTETRILRLSPSWPVEILFEDADLLAINKPAGLLVARDRWDKRKENLMGLLLAGIRDRKGWAREAGIDYLANVHRLDRDTSGVLLLAKSKPALVNLVRQFNQRTPRKHYVALAHGALPEEQVTVDLPIAPHPASPGLSIIDRRGGKAAHTILTVLERYAGFSLVRAEILTGRHHQIRVHLQSLRCPVVGDADYGGKPLLLSRLKRGYKMKPEGERPLIARPALHAERVELAQPTSGAPLRIEAPWPNDLEVAVKYLRKFAGR